MKKHPEWEFTFDCYLMDLFRSDEYLKCVCESLKGVLKFETAKQKLQLWHERGYPEAKYPKYWNQNPDAYFYQWVMDFGL